MAQKNSEERRTQEMIELGKKNAQLWPKVRNWCQHLNIQLVSYGLLAEYTKLPIGRLAIECPHASAGGIQAFQLDRVAASFIIGNCRECAHHKAVSLDNVGIMILEEWQKGQGQAKSQKEITEPAKIRLHQMVSGSLTDALQTEPTTKQSILELVALLDDSAKHNDAAAKLAKASRLAPELFTDMAVEVICSHFPDPEHGRDCITCVRQLPLSSTTQQQLTYKAAELCLLEHHNQDDACALIADRVVARGTPPSKEVIAAALAAQWHVRHFGGERSRYPGSTQLLTEAGRLAPELVREAIAAGLTVNRKEARINTIRAMLALVDALPEVVLELAQPVLKSLELSR